MGETLTARLVFLCASTLGSTQILLNSRSEANPAGLANSSGVLGHYLMDHVTPVAPFVGVLPGLLDRYHSGYRPNNFYIPRFRNLADHQRTDFVRGYGYQGLGLRTSWMRALQAPQILEQLQQSDLLAGAPMKQALRTPGPWFIGINGFGECLPTKGNRVALHPSQTDRWGMPLLQVSFTWGNNERRIFEDMRQQAEAMIQSAGATPLPAPQEIQNGGAAIHEMGTARMDETRRPRY